MFKIYLGLLAIALLSSSVKNKNPMVRRVTTDDQLRSLFETAAISMNQWYPVRLFSDEEKLEIVVTERKPAKKEKFTEARLVFLGDKNSLFQVSLKTKSKNHCFRQKDYDAFKRFFQTKSDSNLLRRASLVAEFTSLKKCK